MRVLLVKTSSMGDVIHNLPAATDIRRYCPDAEIDWVVEESFAAIPAMHPAVRRVIPVAMRRWRRQPFRTGTAAEAAAFARTLRQRRYDMVIDTQGLLKSAAIVALARGPRWGFDRRSIREPLASWAYGHRVSVPRPLHAVERNRLLVAGAFGQAPPDRMDYGIRAAGAAPDWLPRSPYAVFLHATSRADKEWSPESWRALGEDLQRRGWSIVLPWGSSAEHARSRSMAETMASARVPPKMTLDEAAALLANARAVVGVDTGLTHLAAALGTPAVSLYTASDPGLTGVYGSPCAVNLGGVGQPPAPGAVLQALDRVLALR